MPHNILVNLFLIPLNHNKKLPRWFYVISKVVRVRDFFFAEILLSKYVALVMSIGQLVLILVARLLLIVSFFEILQSYGRQRNIISCFSLLLRSSTVLLHPPPVNFNACLIYFMILKSLVPSLSCDFVTIKEPFTLLLMKLLPVSSFHQLTDIFTKTLVLGLIC